jgi:hypothetical protein
MMARIAGGAAVLAVAFAFVTPMAASASGIQKATFKVKVEGVQTTTWRTDHPGTGGCDGAASGDGTEMVRFASRPVRLQAATMRGLSAPVLTAPSSYDEPELQLRGTVTRQGRLEAGPGLCGGDGGGSISPDCGTRAFTGVRLPMAFRLRATPRDQLDLRPGMIDDPFANCPSGGSAFPTLVRTNEGEELRTELPRSELFDASLGRIIVIARGRESETAGEDTYLTTIRWVITFDRIRGRRR